MVYLGVDLGGTNIAIGVVTEDGKILHDGSTPTGVGRPFEEIIGDMGRLGLKVLAEAGYTLEDLKAVGIGSPGSSENVTGTVIFANNLFWSNAPVRQELTKYIPKPIYIDNDANVAGLAEIAIGAAQGVDNLVLLTLGTGVGAGIVLNGEIFGGSHHVGAELGHMTLVVDGEQCTCGNKGCFERYTSATALVREGRKAVVNNPDCMIATRAEGNMDNVTAKIVVDSAKEGDMVALGIFDDYIKYLAMGIVTIINCFDPQVIALGGGVAKAGDFLLDALIPVIEKHIYFKELEHAKVILSPLGNEAGIVGSAMLSKMLVEKG